MSRISVIIVTVLGDSHELIFRSSRSAQMWRAFHEVLSLDGTESLENTKVVQLTEESNYLTATLNIQNNMLLNQEYTEASGDGRRQRCVLLYTITAGR